MIYFRDGGGRRLSPDLRVEDADKWLHEHEKAKGGRPYPVWRRFVYCLWIILAALPVLYILAALSPFLYIFYNVDFLELWGKIGDKIEEWVGA